VEYHTDMPAEHLSTVCVCGLLLCCDRATVEYHTDMSAEHLSTVCVCGLLLCCDRATVEYHTDMSAEHLPPVHVDVATNDVDFIIRCLSASLEFF